MECLEAMVNFSLYADGPRTLCAASYNCATKQAAWMRITHQVRENLADLEGAKLALLRRTARCQLTPLIAPTANADLRGLRKFFCGRGLYGAHVASSHADRI